MFLFELLIRCSVKKCPGVILGLTVLFWFPLFLCPRELKFGMVVNLLAAWYVLFPNYLEVLVGSCHVILVLTYPG